MNTKLIISLFLILFINCSAEKFTAKFKYSSATKDLSPNDLVRCIVDKNWTEFETPKRQFEYFFFAPQNKNVTFQCSSTNECSILLSNRVEKTPISVEIQLYKTPKNDIYVGSAYVKTNTAYNGIMNDGIKAYWVSWEGNDFQIGVLGNSNPFISHVNKDRLDVNYVSFYATGNNPLTAVQDLITVPGHSPGINSKLVTANCEKELRKLLPPSLKAIIANKTK